MGEDIDVYITVILAVAIGVMIVWWLNLVISTTKELLRASYSPPCEEPCQEDYPLDYCE